MTSADPEVRRIAAEKQRATYRLRLINVSAAALDAVHASLQSVGTSRTYRAIGIRETSMRLALKRGAAPAVVAAAIERFAGCATSSPQSE